ncbi:hypothetical protein HDU85_002219 [Gaertneriomyces sp. JEL0708]|nr:hypothetical protein HDU85_002219 [Gaertneriomyces sp. JEL0708]
MMQNVLVYGGSGALGRQIVSHFRRAQWAVTSVDISPNSEAHHNIVLDTQQSSRLPMCGEEVQQKLYQLHNTKQPKLAAIINAAGGWAGGSLADADLYRNSELMFSQSVNTSLISAKLAANHLESGGLLALVGAAGAVDPTPGKHSECLIGYGMAKAAVHHLVRSAATPGSGLPSDSKAIGLLPTMLDTPGNRSAMPNADTSSWTPLEHIAEQLWRWASKKDNATNGALYKITTANAQTHFEAI